MSPSRRACSNDYLLNLWRQRGGTIKTSREMACEACSAKFTLFKRKKQCMDCLRYFCSECVIKRLDKVFTCDSCGLLSRRPLVKNQIRQMRSKDLRQYLVAKKVSVKGCVEKEDLVHLLMLFANGSDPCLNNESTSTRTQTAAQEPVSESMPNVSTSNSEQSGDAYEESQPARSEDIEMDEGERIIESNDNSPLLSFPLSSDNETPEEERSIRRDSVEIIEVTETDNDPVVPEASSAPDNAPEPIIAEQEEVSEASSENKSNIRITEILTSDKVQLSDIKETSELEYLNVKQLKNLLSTNRVDYKGCIERQELLNKVTRLWNEYNQSRKEVENLSEEELCKICWDAPIECVILECGHMACCINCGKQMSECPICKQYVVRVVRFFKA
ncbi:E3 ubiquitin-protein ligase RNF34 isoform X2 [Pseudomyrmex gracilis]|uniref:E3 ubiquitin-protein ligase RNF34 isoform X2 n=1 Tax=Pseudomyrmex gracilis TaxID=219809 RepID=UPI0009952F66|nr:E3 ubiquitin-protein ligase RNF34 isoform X2 [Pseudomyrmex gracilis]